VGGRQGTKRGGDDGSLAYSNQEIRFSTIPLAFGAAYCIFLIPNDFRFVSEATILCLLVGFRALASLAMLGAIVQVLRRPSSRANPAILTAALAIMAAVDILTGVNRPPSAFLSVLPSFLLMVIVYFATPIAPKAKLAICLGESLWHLVEAFTLKDFPPSAELVLALTYLGINAVGIINLAVLGRLRFVEAEYRSRLEDEARFKAAMSDTVHRAILLVEGARIVDANRYCCDILVKERYALAGRPLDEVLKLPAEGRGALGGGTAEAFLLGEKGEIPVSVMERAVEIEGRRYRAILARETLADERGQIGGWLEGLALSRREEEVAQAIIDGHSRAEIAQRLYISEQTVKKHVANIYRKLGINSRAELFHIALSFSGEARLREGQRQIS
jgi:DNA-binding CsgD family transcriptional regulator